MTISSGQKAFLHRINRHPHRGRIIYDADFKIKIMIDNELQTKEQEGYSDKNYKN